MNNKPKYYKLRERDGPRKRNSQISQFFSSQDNPQSPKEIESCDQAFSEAPPSKRSRESPEKLENKSIYAPDPGFPKSNSPLKEGKEDNVELPLPQPKRQTKNKARNTIKEFFDQRDSDGELDPPKTKVPRKPTVQKTSSRGKRGGGRSKGKQASIKSALLKNEEMFSEFIAQHSAAENIDPYEMQLALALSKSEIETSGQHDLSAEEGTSELGLIQNAREKLKQYGFKTSGNERDYDIIIKTGSKKGKWANKFTPLTLRNPEKQDKKLEEKIQQILNCSSSKEATISNNNNFVMTSEFLKMFTGDRELSRTLNEMHKIDESYIFYYYVVDLFMPTYTKLGYLLKDWRKIPGRDLSPTRAKTEVKKDLPELGANDAINNENGSPNVIKKSCDNENDSADIIVRISENEDYPEYITLKTLEKRNDLPKESSYLSENGFIQEEEILNEDDRLAVNISGNTSVYVDHPENKELLYNSSNAKGEVNGISLTTVTLKINEDERKEVAVGKEEPLVAFNKLNIINEVRFQQRETSPDLFTDSDNSIHEEADQCENPKRVASQSNPVEAFLDKIHENPLEENIVISYEKYSSDEIKVSDNTTPEKTEYSNIKYLRKVPSNECCIDLTCHSDSNPELNECEEENKNEISEFLNVKNNDIFDAKMPEKNILQLSQKSDCSNNLSQSQSNTGKDLTEDSCIILSDDEVNYSIKMANKTFSNPIDLTFSSSSECDDEGSKNKSMYNVKVSSSKIGEQNFSFIALIGETDSVSPSKSNESLNIESPMKSPKTSYQCFKKISPIKRLSLSQNTDLRHYNNTPARKSLSFVNCDTNTSFDCEISPSGKRLATCNTVDDHLAGERLVYDKFNTLACNRRTQETSSTQPFSLLLDKSPNFEKQFASDIEISDEECNDKKMYNQRRSKIPHHTITSTVEKKTETDLVQSFRGSRTLSDSVIKSKTLKTSPILKKYSTSHKSNEFVTDDVDFSDVDEIDKLIYSPIKKLTPKKPQGMEKLLHAELSFTETNSPRKYVHDGKTYLVRTENISPKPDYRRMDSPTILKQLYKYGIKPLKRKHAIAILEHIYDQTHPFVVENGDDDSSDDEDILKVSTSPLKGLQFEKGGQKNKKDQNNYNTFRLEDCVGEKLLDFNDLFSEIDDEEYIFPTNVRSKVSTARLPFHVAWYNVVKSSYSLREALLHYEPIDLQEIYLFLKKLGHRYDPKDMKKFFDKRCIIFRYDLSDGTSKRHERKNKRILSQKALI